MKVFKNAITLTIALVVLCGLVFPLAVTGIGQIAFSKKANGSIIEINGKKVGSELMGQNFTDERFFHGRPSAVSYNTYTENDIKPDKDGNTAYSGVASGSSNLAASNPALKERIEKDVYEFLKSHKGVKKEDIPSDLITMSASGLDPDISFKAAQIQIPLISKKTGISEQDLEKIIKRNTKKKTLGVLGEERVNVLKANIEISKILAQ